MTLGNLDAVRDWGYAPEYVEGMWRMLQNDEPDDYVLATGEGHTVREFCEAAFSHAGLDWHDHVRYDERFERPAEVDALVGDASKAHRDLDWKAQTTALDLAPLMVDVRPRGDGPLPRSATLSDRSRVGLRRASRSWRLRWRLVPAPAWALPARA